MAMKWRQDGCQVHTRTGEKSFAMRCLAFMLGSLGLAITALPAAAQQADGMGSSFSFGAAAPLGLATGLALYVILRARR